MADKYLNLGRPDYQNRFIDVGDKISAEEPCMLFRAQDMWAPHVVKHYATLLEASGNPQMADMARATARNMEEFQKRHDLHRQPTLDL